MDNRQWVFNDVYKGFKNFMTPHIDRYYGSVCSDGTPAASNYICELSHGKYRNTLVYGVTVIFYDNRTRKWEQKHNLSDVFMSKRIAEQYASDIIKLRVGGL